MEPHHSEPSHELDDLPSPAVVSSDAAGDDGHNGNDGENRHAERSPVSHAWLPSTHHGRPRVRFNSRADVLGGPSRTRGGRQQPLGSPDAQEPRPALSRNPDSFGSGSGDVAHEHLGRGVHSPTAAVPQRARVAPIDTWHNSTSNRRWSTDSEGTVDAGRSGVPMADSHTSPRTHRDVNPGDSTTNFEAEAEGLLKVHTRHLESALRDIATESPRSELNSGLADDTHVSSGNAKGGVFYQILQAYRNPVYDSLRDQEFKKTITPASSGESTPSRRKWYQQEKEAPSQETVARLAAASIKLASLGDKTSAVQVPPEVRRRRRHKRTASGKIMSMMGLAREEEAKITVHVADILKRQKYIVKMCRALMLFGAPTHRLEEYLAMSARVLEIDSQFLYIPDCMIISFDDVLTHTTDVRIVRTAQSVNLGKLKDVHDIYKEVLHDVISLDDALSRLDQVIKADALFPVWVCILMYGLASAAVSCFFKARLIDLPIIFSLGTLLGFLQLVLAPRSKTYNTVFEVSATILLSFLARAFGSIRGGKLFCFSAITQGSIAMILPGWLVLSSALELHSKAMVPGAIRLVYAIVYSLFLVYGITVGTALYGAFDSNAVTETTCQNPLNPYWNFLFVPLYIFFVTFTVQAKWTQMPVMVFIALAGYTVNFFTSQRFAASPSIAYTFGAFTVGVLANLYSRFRHGVAAAVLLPAVYIQVPGSLASTNAITSGLAVAGNLTSSHGSVISDVSIKTSMITQSAVDPLSLLSSSYLRRL
ncbi:hypothetical protein F5Y14DRAFT_156618 [Nemania sp. NC0429]|nr:hypothetical protein F5Y14DRAFT_156618 [Nemania sp. NC0429]